ncbi:FRG domain-containing protein [Aureliella helgolandensis]|uniref:FRG domain protein n=1 Tax=Aureliella helgolandensis TaxID=2527968 RepID=A0A518G9P0_9BACT|nr:FRG domain-containing protein [Aureliella helgolandensis]QDV25314.1 FRG domain protein [Aureliella helgolandensis]
MTTENVEIIEIKSAKDFLAALRPSNDLWLASGSSIHPWVFRGHRNEQWKLEPTAWREQTLSSSRFMDVRSYVDEEIIERTISINSTFSNIHQIDKERIRGFVAQRRFEFLEVQAFCALVDDLGFTVPGGPISMELSLDFTSGSSLETPHHAVALAQHHGMHTRLIDWTRNPLAAAFFAAEKVNETDGKLCVWAFNRRALINNVDWKELFVPRSEIGFLHAQAGLFTYCPMADGLFLFNGRWPVMEEMISGNEYCEFAFRKLTLPWSEAPELRRLLYAESVSKAHLMPSYDNVRETLCNLWDEYERTAKLSANSGESVNNRDQRSKQQLTETASACSETNVQSLHGDSQTD